MRAMRISAYLLCLRHALEPPCDGDEAQTHGSVGSTSTGSPTPACAVPVSVYLFRVRLL